MPAETDAKGLERFGKCCLCGVESTLSFEHVPPKKAFNNSSLRSADVQQLLSGIDPRDVRRSTERKGAGAYTLCMKCNNDTGGWYGPAYVSWAHQGMRFRLAGGSSLALPFFCYPGRVAKQIMCMFASTCGPEFCETNPAVRKYVLDREARGIPDTMRILVYMISERSNQTRHSGVVGMLAGSKPHVFSEISFMPFGYILTLDSEPPAAGLTDITFFANHAFNEWRDIHLPMPIREVNSYFPADFRTAEEWETTLNNTRDKRRTKSKE